MLVSKYHGCGNDFIITRYENVKDLDIKDFVISVCDRHTGIGADGCILVKQDPLEMVFYNCDGSRAPMCGNGIRCFAKYCLDEHIEIRSQYSVNTLAGVKLVKRIRTEPFLVEIDMGKPDYRLEMIHVRKGVENMMKVPMKVKGTTVELYSFFMSTVHTVVFVEDAFAKENEEIGRIICHDPLFEEQTNVNFVEIVDNHTIRMQTYERGVGMTLACGTGACASALMAHKEKGCDSHIAVILRRGELRIEVDEEENVKMSGPASRTLKGEYQYVSC